MGNNGEERGNNGLWTIREMGTIRQLRRRRSLLLAEM